ncbi:hypothetical protein CGCF413_v009962 [Colletotrichum fructicola]|nr:hypothetical protein CFRS1_v007694 [Colletotrichum fructicola]KAF5493482.1 hypothetical protein CGCF413_v009962 [Colletotrichum fructicola]
MVISHGGGSFSVKTELNTCEVSQMTLESQHQDSSSCGSHSVSPMPSRWWESAYPRDDRALISSELLSECLHTL